MSESAKYTYAKDLNNLEMLQASFRRQTFGKHVHEGFCIGVIEQGAQAFYHSGEIHVADTNSIILVNADEVHTGNSATDYGWSYKAIYPTAEHFELIGSELSQAGCTPYFNQSVLHDPLLASQLKRLYELIADPLNHATLERQTVYLEVMTLLIQRHNRHHFLSPVTGSEHWAIQQIKDYLNANMDQNISLDDLSTLVQLNPHYLVRTFQKATGLPPHAYHVQTRLHQAKALLAHGQPISHVALNTGFTDQSHLNRHFKKAFGVTPGKFQQQARH